MSVGKTKTATPVPAGGARLAVAGRGGARRPVTAPAAPTRGEGNMSTRPRVASREGHAGLEGAGARPAAGFPCH